MEENSTYDRIMEMPESTVVSSYEPQALVREAAYQSEAQLEEAFLGQLTRQGYERLSLHTEAELIANLRLQLEKLNQIQFSDNEWQTFFQTVIASANDGIVEKTRRIQEEPLQLLHRDDGTFVNVKLIDKKQIHNNFLQVLNQYVEAGGTHKTRYDVTILVNGLPLVHVELKRRGVRLKEAFNQINRYQRDSFWASSGLFEYVQIFVISNGTHTKYYSNTTRDSHVKEMVHQRKKSKKTSNSFAFTMYWADAKNHLITDLMDFARTFFARHTLLQILTKFCVFTTENLLLVMRPYQIAATERILNKIEVATNYKQYGTRDGGGYIWHTTGSGKTLTSFKTAQLATQLPYIDKVLFVVDRKDLDYQTIREYDRFAKGAANGNRNTKILQQQLENPQARIIVTTIQKLATFISKNRQHPVYQKHVVLIFDECHRSQFGKMHTEITKHFKKYHIFGFTGTPIFAVNASSGGNPNLKTTEQAFGRCLHTYTIVNAIHDGNVLPFRIDYINTIKRKNEEQDEQVTGINTEEVLSAPERVQKVCTYILDHFDQKTCRNKFYDLKGKRMAGFNSLFAVSSIPMCKKYYLEFKRQLAERHSGLRIATIFSYAPNEDEPEGILADESFDTSDLDQSSRDFLDSAIGDYNALFHTNFDTSANGFQDYYKDLSEKVKKREVDILIVVNMFLTGFDATTLNTLWVDKNLKMHGLIQAFSRTNRILNSVKAFGNIVCFRNLEKATNDAIALFGDREAQGIVLLKTFDEYYQGYEEKGKHVKGYAERITEFLEQFPLGQEIVGEKAEKEYIAQFGAILRLRNILAAFDQFKDKDLLQPIDLQDYTGIYQDLHDKYRQAKQEKESILDDVVFEMELVRQVEVNIDYILMLVKKYHASHCQDKTILTAIDKAVHASPNLRSKKELIDKFIKTVNAETKVDEDWQKFAHAEEQTELADIIKKMRLKEEPARKLVEDSFRDGELKTSGTSIDRIMPPMSRFAKANGRARKKEGIIARLKQFFTKYVGII